MASIAVAGVGTQFVRWNGAAWEAIAEINSITGPSMGRETIDVTSLDTETGYRQFITGFKNGGTVVLAMNFTRDTYELMKDDFEVDDPHDYGMVLPDEDETVLQFSALVTELPMTIPADDKITADVTLQITGEVKVLGGELSDGDGNGDEETQFDLYANFHGEDIVFSDGDKLSEGEHGIEKGNLYVKSTSTGVIAMADNYMIGYGAGNYTDTILYGDSINIEYGRILKFSFISRFRIMEFMAGLCESDLSNTSTSRARMYSAVSGYTMYYPYWSKFAVQTSYCEYEIMFVLGGFDSNGNAYTEGDKNGYDNGYYLFIRSNVFPYWFLAGICVDSIGSEVVPYFAFRSTDTPPYEKVIIKDIMSYFQPEFECLPQGAINVSNNDEFEGFDVENTMLYFKTDITTYQEVNLYFCIDEYNNPSEGYRLKITRGKANTNFTLYRIDAGINTNLVTSQDVGGGQVESIFRFYKGTIWGAHFLTGFAGLDISDYSDNNKAKIENGASSYLKNMVWYSFGADAEYREQLIIQKPFFEGLPAPGYNLSGETRKGHYFDVSSQCNTYGNESIGVIMYLENGSDKARVRWRSHTNKKWIPELEVVLNLRYSYVGNNEIIYIGSDPHFGYAALDTYINYENQIIPDLISLNVTRCMILGDIVHDNAAYYAEYIAAKSLLPSVPWYEITGNHDVLADFLTDLGYDDVSYLVTIGNCVFIMCGSLDKNTVIDHTFLKNSLEDNENVNCFIMTHAGRENTTVSTDTAPCQPIANVEIAVGSNKFVAWFAAHQHGWIENVRKVTRAKYLNLGDNN